MGALIIDKVLRSRDNYAVSRENIPSERGRTLSIGDRTEKPAGVVGVALAVFAIRPALQQILGVIGIFCIALLNKIAVLVVGILILAVTYELVRGIVGIVCSYAIPGLGEHIAHRVIHIALGITVRALKACELTQLIIFVVACKGRAILGAALLRYAPGLVIVILESKVIRAGEIN